MAVSSSGERGRLPASCCVDSLFCTRSSFLRSADLREAVSDPPAAWVRERGLRDSDALGPLQSSVPPASSRAPPLDCTRMASQPSGPFCAPAAAPVRRASLSSGRSSYPTFPDPTAHAAPPIASSSTPTLDAAFCYLPPGLGLNVKGASAVYLDRDDFVEDLSDGRGELSLPHLTSTSEPSRRGGGSSSSSSEESGSGGVEDSAMSPTSSLASSTIEEPKHPAGGLGGRTKWAAGLEDPGLEAARRALWEDPDEPTSAAGSEGEEGGDSVDADNESEEEDDTDEDTGDEEFWVLRLPPVPTPSSPAHATLNPLPSCLRPPLPSRSASGSSSSSAPSVQFATQRTFTYVRTVSPFDTSTGAELFLWQPHVLSIRLPAPRRRARREALRQGMVRAQERARSRRALQRQDCALAGRPSPSVERRRQRVQFVYPDRRALQERIHHHRRRHEEELWPTRRDNRDPQRRRP